MTASAAPTMSVRCVWPFRGVTRDLGLDFDAAWASLGLTPEDMANPETRVPIAAAQRRARWSVDASGAWDLGVRAALAAEAGFFDMAEYAARCQPNVEGSLRCVVRLIPLLIDAGRFEWTDTVDGATLRWAHAPDAELDAVSIEFMFAYVIIAGRRHVGRDDFAPTLVRFRHAAWPDVRAHEAHFRCPIEFGATEDSLSFSHAQLELPLRQADSHLSALLDQAATHLLARMRSDTGPFSDDVRHLITKHLPNDGAPVTAIAHELGITPRTLHRRLASEQTTFRDLADDVRKGLALAHVEQGDLGMSEIAYLLGFSGVQAFHRAFKRWTGKTPGTYRKG
jgi:AraC-like DNA-binding protein